MVEIDWTEFQLNCQAAFYAHIDRMVLVIMKERILDPMMEDKPKLILIQGGLCAKNN